MDACGVWCARRSDGTPAGAVSPRIRVADSAQGVGMREDTGPLCGPDDMSATPREQYHITRPLNPSQFMEFWGDFGELAAERPRQVDVLETQRRAFIDNDGAMEFVCLSYLWI